MKYLKTMGKQGAFLIAIALAAVAGGVTTALVSAAIPDSSGAIHGCYRNNANLTNPKGALRVVDSEASQTCSAQETSLNWAAGADTHKIAYAALNADGTINTSFSEGVNAVKFVPFNPDDPDGFMCFDLTFVPKSAFADQEGMHMWSAMRDSVVHATCGSDYDALALGGIQPGSFQNPTYTFLN